MVKIKKQLISNTSNKSGTKNPAKFITWHTTGNTSRGAGAQAHANLQSNGNSRSANWHWQVDDKIAIQSFEHYFQLWHAGDGGYGAGTLESIGVEGCVNSDGNFNKMIDNMIDLTVHIMEEENIDTVYAVVTHYWWSGKWCPTQILNGLNGWTYDYMIKELEKRLGKPVKVKKKNKTPVSKQRATNRTVATQVINGMWGDGEERKRRLKNAGYNFNTVQGIVNDILSGSKTQSLSNKQSNIHRSNTNKHVKKMANEVEAGKHGTGHANRRKSLGISSALYQQVRQEVNRRAGVGNETRGKSVNQMATEVLKGLHGTGHANRRKSLGISSALYQRVRDEVNRRA